MSTIFCIELFVAFEIQISLQFSERYDKPKLRPYSQDL